MVHLVYFSLIQYSNLLKGTRKTLILREIPEGDVRSLLSDRESLAPCDVAVFVYDRYMLFTNLFFYIFIPIGGVSSFHWQNLHKLNHIFFLLCVSANLNEPFVLTLLDGL